GRQRHNILTPQANNENTISTYPCRIGNQFRFADLRPTNKQPKQYSQWIRIREEQTMTPIKLSRFASAFQLSVAALLVCGSQTYAQRVVDPRHLPPHLPARPALTAHPPPVATGTPLLEAVGTFITFDAPGGCETPASFPALNSLDIFGVQYLSQPWH